LTPIRIRGPDGSPRSTLRFTPHTLGLEAESVLASTGDVLAQPNNLYQQLVDAELPYPMIEIDGKKVHLTQTEYEKYRSSDDRGQRKLVFDLNPRQYPVERIVAELESAGFARVALRPFLVPQTKRVPVAALGLVGVLERTPPARLALRRRFTYLVAAVVD
jgi:hypothetical protein